MKDNILSFKAAVDKKDLEKFAEVLFEKYIELQIENQKLKEKLEHLEELLINSNVPNIGEK